MGVKVFRGGGFIRENRRSLISTDNMYYLKNKMTELCISVVKGLSLIPRSAGSHFFHSPRQKVSRIVISGIKERTLELGFAA